MFTLYTTKENKERTFMSLRLSGRITCVGDFVCYYLLALLLCCFCWGPEEGAAEGVR